MCAFSLKDNKRLLVCLVWGSALAIKMMACDWSEIIRNWSIMARNPTTTIDLLQRKYRGDLLLLNLVLLPKIQSIDYAGAKYLE